MDLLQPSPLHRARSRTRGAQIGSVLLVSLLGLAIASCGGEGPDEEADPSGTASDTLTVAIDPTFRPLAFTNEAGELTGFDVDLARELADHMGRELEFEELAFDGIIPALNAGNVDTNVDLAVTEDRKEEVSFTKPYLQQTNIAVVRASETDLNPTLEELRELEVGVVSGTSSDQLLAQTPEVSPTRYNSVPDAFRELQLGRLDAVVINSLTAGFFVTSVFPEELRLSDQPVSDDTIGVAAVAAKGNTELVTEMNRALDEMRADGSLNRVSTKWFGTEVGEVVGG